MSPLVVGLAISCILVNRGSGSMIEADAAELLRTSYHAAFGEFLNGGRTPGGVATETITQDARLPGAQVRSYRIRYHARERYERVDRLRLTDDPFNLERTSLPGFAKGFEEVALIGPEHSFRVTRASATRPYALSYLGKDKSQVDGIIGDGRMKFQCMYRMVMITVADTLDPAKYDLPSIAFVDENSRIRAEFQRKSPPDFTWEGMEPAQVPSHGWYIVSPRNHWRLEEFKLSFDNGQVDHCAVLYDETDSSGLRPTSFVFEGERNGYKTRIVDNFEEFQWGEADLGQFDLALFGLQGATAVAAPHDPNRASYWLIGIGTLGIALGIVAGRLARAGGKAERTKGLHG